MQKHTVIGYEILKYSERPLMEAAAIVAYEHHEKYDGTGYPRNLKGDIIHIYGRILAIADVFDALASTRAYKDAWADEKIVDYLKEQSGKHFDPDLIELFVKKFL